MARQIRGKKEGSIHQRKNGQWRGQISLPNGQRVSRDWKTKSEVQLWIRQMQTDLDKGFNVQASKMLLKDYLAKWLEASKIALRPKTAYDYEMSLRKHVVPKLGNFALKDITPTHIERFIVNLVESGVGIRTIRLAHTILHRAFERAVDKGLMLRNPATNTTLPRYKQSEMKVLDEAQVNQFLLASQGSRYEALYHLAVKTGMRQGELLGLKWSDLHWNSGLLDIRRQVQEVRGQGRIFQEPKTRAGTRTIQLGEGTLQALRVHQERQQFEIAFAGRRWVENELIFPSIKGTPVSHSNLTKDFKRTLELAGVPKIRFHDLRHTAASLMLNHGIPAIVVSKVLGHSKPSITLDIYGHFYHEMQSRVAALMDELVTPVKVDFQIKDKQEVDSEQVQS